MVRFSDIQCRVFAGTTVPELTLGLWSVKASIARNARISIVSTRPDGMSHFPMIARSLHIAHLRLPNRYTVTRARSLVVSLSLLLCVCVASVGERDSHELFSSFFLHSSSCVSFACFSFFFDNSFPAAVPWATSHNNRCWLKATPHLRNCSDPSLPCCAGDHLLRCRCDLAFMKYFANAFRNSICEKGSQNRGMPDVHSQP